MLDSPPLPGTMAPMKESTAAQQPWTPVAYQDASTDCYLGSPSLLRLADGRLLATHDYFGPGAPLNHEGEEFLTTVYRSEDGGAHWSRITHLAGAFWSGLFSHGGAVYLLGVSAHYGSIVIRRSDDGGSTWTRPLDADTGLLFAGGPGRQPPNYHCAPVPVLRAGGRLYRAFEDCTPCEWGTGFQALVISASEDADLLRAESWTMSSPLPFRREWLPERWREMPRPGWLEGNAVQAPDGTLWNILRFNSAPWVDVAAMVRIADEGRALRFDPETGYVTLPGGMTKFTIRREPQTGLYLTLSNNNTDPACPTQRNVLSLHASEDLRHWRHVRTLLEDDSGLPWEESLRRTGFQYVDWQFDGEDLIYLVRTAYRGAHSYHDANRITFHRLPGYRGLL